MNDRKQKLLVVTGGSKGIGFAIAQRFAENGYRIVNLSRAAIAMPGAIQITVDFRSKAWREDIAPQLSQALADSGEICLVHNSAYQHPGGVGEIDEPGLRQSLEVNVVAPTLLNTLVLPHMQAGSSIIYIGSTLSSRATKGMAAYVISKHAIAGLMKSTAQDLAGKAIHTVCVCPGFTDTEMLRSYGGDALQHLSSLVTQQRLILPEEIATTVFHASESPVLNGSMIQADLAFIEP